MNENKFFHITFTLRFKNIPPLTFNNKIIPIVDLS